MGIRRLWESYRAVSPLTLPSSTPLTLTKRQRSLPLDLV